MEVWQLGIKYLILLGFLENQSVAEVWQKCGNCHTFHIIKKIHKLMVAQGPGPGGSRYYI